LVALVPKLRALGDEGEVALFRLMNDSSEGVACWAATHSLPFAELAALEVLDNLAKKTGPIGFDARMVAEMWRSGKLVIP
jgi:hypothetical protein